VLETFFKHFRFVTASHFLSCYVNIVRMLAIIYSKRGDHKFFFTRTLYKGLLVSLSFMEPEKFSEEASIPPLDYDVTLKYCELWKNLLSSANQHNVSPVILTPSQRESLFDSLYDSFIASILRIIEKLDLSVESNTLAGGEETVRPKVSSDFQLFISLVELCKYTISTVEVKRFRRWVYVFSSRIVVLADIHPHVSGVYKLMTLCFKNCERLHFLSGKKELDPNKKLCFHLFEDYARKASVKIKLFKYGLLAACLESLLALPLLLVDALVESLVQALQVSLRVGLNYPPIVSDVLDAMEVWAEALPLASLQRCCRGVLPFIRPYLSTAVSISVTPPVRPRALQSNPKLATPYDQVFPGCWVARF
jgi:hypothetical protein